MTGVLPFVVRRLLAAIPVLILVTAGTFWLCRYAPGDPVTVRTGGRASPEAVARVKHQLHLDEPIIVQYVRYMGDLLHGDLGVSQHHEGVPVADIIFPKLKISAEEDLSPLLLVFILGVPLGIYLARRRGHWDDPTITAAMLTISAIPVFISIPALQVLLAVKLKLVPTGGWHGLFSKTVILPSIVLTYAGVVGIARLMRISLLQVMGDDYVRTARAKGLSERTVVYRHVLRNAMLPLITAVLYSLFGIAFGDFFTELLLGIPGIGAESFTSIGSRDYDEIMAITIIGAVVFILANLTLDIVYTFVDPRITLETS